MKKEKRSTIEELGGAAVAVSGFVVFVRGVWLAWRPGGWMVAGLAIAAPALFWLYGRVRKASVAAARGRSN